MNYWPRSLFGRLTLLLLVLANAGYFAWAQGLLQAWGLGQGGGWNHPSWSISAEWFAYLLFPVFAVDEAWVGHAREVAAARAAYVAGFGWAREQGYDVVVEMDADGSHAPEQLPRLLAALENADLVELVGPAVVNIRTTERVRSARGSSAAHPGRAPCATPVSRSSAFTS